MFVYELSGCGFESRCSHLNFRVAVTAQQSETEALFSSKFTLFSECLTKEYHQYYDNDAQAFEIYNFNGKSTTPNIKGTAAVVDLSAVVCAKAAVTAAETFEQVSLEVVCSIQDTTTSYSGVNVTTDSYFDRSLKTDARYNRDVGQYFPFT